MTNTVETLPRNDEARWALGYFVGYMIYHTAVGGETDPMHWIGLVLLPMAGLFALHRAREPAGGRGGGFGRTLASVGLARDRWRRGVGWAVALGLGISLLQTMGRFEETMEIVRSGRVLWLYPAVLLILFLTAGFTEEIFFRGILQLRIERWSGRPWVGVLVTSVLFSVYHIPYTYLNPNWPSSGDLGAAVQAAFVNGMMGGVVLGILFIRSKHNLVATIALHSLINSIPAMSLIRFG